MVTKYIEDNLKVTIMQLDIPIPEMSQPYLPLGISHLLTFSSESLAYAIDFPLSLPRFLFSMCSKTHTFLFILYPFTSLFVSFPALFSPGCATMALYDQTHP